MRIMADERYSGILRRMAYELFGVGGGEDVPMPAPGVHAPPQAAEPVLPAEPGRGTR